MEFWLAVLQKGLCFWASAFTLIGPKLLLQPEPAMYSCFCWFPGPFTPSKYKPVDKSDWCQMSFPEVLRSSENTHQIHWNTFQSFHLRQVPLNQCPKSWWKEWISWKLIRMETYNQRKQNSYNISSSSMRGALPSQMISKKHPKVTISQIIICW